MIMTFTDVFHTTILIAIVVLWGVVLCHDYIWKDGDEE